MTPRQRRIIGVLVVANVALLVTLLVLVNRAQLGPRPLSQRSSGSTSPLRLPSEDAQRLSPVPTDRARASFSPVCRRRAVQLLSQAGLGGTATLGRVNASLADQTLRFDLVHRVAQDGGAEDVAQQVWVAFDVALALASGECDAFSRIEIVIEAQGTSPPIRVYAAVDTTDLKAFYGGELGESTFIDRVDYRIGPLDDS